MSEDKTLFQTGWIAVKETTKGFQYLERKGKKSVAVFLVRRCGGGDPGFEVLIRMQPLCIDSSDAKLYPCPITGSLDAGEQPERAAVREVYEESGFSVYLLPLGKYIVGTQTNEVCYMYYADVTGLEPDEALQDGSYHESISRNEWQSIAYLNDCEYAGCQIGYFRLREALNL